jgi:hypothetical protein
MRGAKTATNKTTRQKIRALFYICFYAQMTPVIKLLQNSIIDRPLFGSEVFVFVSRNPSRKNRSPSKNEGHERGINREIENK